MSNYGHGNLYKPEERFWHYVNKNAKGGCWEWTGGCTRQGYGRYTIHHNLRTVGAHKYSWELHKGEVPDKLLVLHKCNNRKCVNPRHLYVGTQKQNMKDRSEHGNLVIGENHWKSKLTWEDVDKIREMYASGKFSQSVLGKMFNTPQTNISNIVLWRNWIPMNIRRSDKGIERLLETKVIRK